MEAAIVSFLMVTKVGYACAMCIIRVTTQELILEHCHSITGSAQTTIFMAGAPGFDLRRTADLRLKISFAHTKNKASMRF